MEFVILGLLLIRDHTLYEIKKAFEDAIALFYSASFGSIGTALGKLVEKQWITLTEETEQGRHKKIYAITPSGTLAFQAWLRSPIPSEKVKDPALTRLFFLSFLPLPERIAVLEEHIATLHHVLQTLTLLSLQMERAVHEEAQADQVAFQSYTLQYGQDYYAFSLAWFNRLLTTLKEDDHGPA